MLAVIGGFKSFSEFVKAHRKPIGICIGILVLIAVIWWGITRLQRADNYDALKKEYDALQASFSETTTALDEATEQLDTVKKELAYQEQQATLLKKSTNALKEQVAGLNAEKEELNSELEDLLRIQETVPTITRNELEAQISSLSELVTKKFWYRNAAQKDSDKTWLWGWTMPFSDVSLLATYDGAITTSIDLKQIKFNINESTKTITVTIPQSKIFDHNIPQETINVLQVRNNLFNSISFNDYNQFISAEKPVMEAEAIERGLLTDADKEAQQIIKVFLEKIPGMEAYTLKFEQAK